MTRQDATRYHDLKEISSRIAHRLTGYLMHVEVSFLAGNNMFSMDILLTKEKNFGGNYTLGEKDMRFYVSNINAELKDYDIVKHFDYIQKPKPKYMKTRYLGNEINWNLGYNTNKIKLNIETI